VRLISSVQLGVVSLYKKEWLMRKRTLLLVSLALAMILVVSGVALAKTVVGTEGDDVIIGTKKADDLRGAGGEDVIRGRAGDDLMRGDDQSDELYGNKGGDRIDTAGRWADVVDCGPGRDWVKVDSTDQHGHCERVELDEPPADPQAVAATAAD
jgi:Ca2+-binding RTX toxin-like protein